MKIFKDVFSGKPFWSPEHFSYLLFLPNVERWTRFWRICEVWHSEFEKMTFVEFQVMNCSPTPTQWLWRTMLCMKSSARYVFWQPQIFRVFDLRVWWIFAKTMNFIKAQRLVYLALIPREQFWLLNSWSLSSLWLLFTCELAEKLETRKCKLHIRAFFRLLPL